MICNNCGLTNRPYHTECAVCSKTLQDPEAASVHRREWEQLSPPLREEFEKDFDRFRKTYDDQNEWLKRYRVIQAVAGAIVLTTCINLDVLSYLDGKWIQEDIEYELFNWVLGDNENEKVFIRVPNVGGITSTPLFWLTRVLQDFHFVRRRVRATPSPLDGPDGPELVAFYEVTNSGKKLRHLLMQIDVGKQLLSLRASDEGDES